MDKKSKKSNFLRNLLATASITSVIVGGSSAAFGVARDTANAASAFATPGHWNPAAVVGDGDSLKFTAGNAGMVGDANNTVTINNNGIGATTLEVGNNTVGVAGVVGVRALEITATHANARIILGLNGVARGAFAAPGEVGVYTGLKTIDFANTAANVVITTDDFNAQVDFLSTGGNKGTVTIDAERVTLSGTWNAANGTQVKGLVVNDGKSVTITNHLALNQDVTLGGNANTIGGTLTIGDNQNVTVREIKGANDNTGTLIFNGASNVIAKIGATAGKALKEIRIGNGTVDFQGILGAIDIKAQKISLTHGNSVIKLSSRDQTVTGDITTTTGNQGTLEFNGDHVYIVNGSVGSSACELANISFGAAANTRTITGEVFTHNIDSSGSVINFNKNVYVSGVTNLKAAPTTINIGENKTASLGRVNFNGLGSTINVGANANGGTLIGTFENTGAVVAGTIHFVGGGIFDGTATRLALIDIANAGVLKFSGGINSVTDIKAMIAGAHFEFDDKYELTGSINGGGAGVRPNLDFKGNAKLTGGIGNVHDGVGNISIAKDKKLTVDSDAIRAVSIFDKTDQGTLTLIHKPANVTITSQISPFGGGTIDATGMTAGKDLIIVGDIGTNPAHAGHALEKMLLKGQNLILRPGAVANIAGIDFDKKASTVTFDTPGSYALGNLTDAENVTLNINNITLYNTKTKDKLKETKFLANHTLTLGKDNDITVAAVTTANNDQGTLVFAGDSALRGPIGTANKKLKAITVNNDVTATTSGPAFVEGDVTLGDEKSVLVIDSNYTVSKFVGGADGVGTLRFVNKDPVILKTTFTHLPPPPPIVPVNAIETLELTDGDVKLSAPEGLRFKKIIFTSVAPAAAPATTATAPTLILDRSLLGIDVDSNFDTTTTGDMPTVQLIEQGYNYFSKDNYVGKDKDHLVNIKLGDKLDVRTKKFFAAVTTGVDGKGKVDFGNEADKVYGLGSEKFKLDTVRLFTNVENFGDTYAQEVVVFADKTYTAGGTISGGVLRLGDNAFATAIDEVAKRTNNDPVAIGNAVAAFITMKVSDTEGGAIAVFNDGVTLLDDVISVGTDNKLNFAGNAVIKGKIGVSGNAFSGMVTFTGDKDRTATLYSDMYVKDVNFGAETLKVAADQVTIGGVSHVNGTIALDSNQLILKNTGTWGTNTNISTTLTRSGKLGKIVLNGAITVDGNVPVTVKITDHASLKDHRSNEYTFIDGYNHLAMADGSVNIDKIIGDVETNQAYSEWKLRVEGSDLIFTRICDEVKGVKKDLDGIGDDIDQQNAKMLAGIQGGDAAKYLDDINLIDKAQGGKAKRAESMQRLMNTESTQVTETIGNTVGHVTNIVNSRLFSITGQSGIVAAGSDDGSTSMGAWVMPYYSQAVQKNKGGSVGYAVKSGGGVLGFDALANENLTIGAAVSIIKSNMKFKGYKAGEKTAIDTLMLSIYGSQQLAKDFFVQAVASFGSSKVKNTDPRIVSVNTNASGLQTAKASYNSMSYGGELLFGYNAKVDDSVLLTPMAGIRYTRFNGEGYKETGTTSQNKDIRQKASNRVEAIVGARVATTVDTSGITVTPEVHAFVSQKLSGKSGKVDARLDGMTSPFTTRPDKGAKTSFNVGVGVSAKAGVMEYGVGYDAHLANKYVGHQGTLKVRVNF